MLATVWGRAALGAGALTLVCAAAVLACARPMVAVLVVLAVGAGNAMRQFGVVATLMSAALLSLGLLSGTEYWQLGVVVMLILGAVGFVKVGMPRTFRFGLILFVLGSILFAVPSAGNSPEYAARGVLSLVFPIFAGLAGTYTWGSAAPGARKAMSAVAALVVAMNSFWAIRQSLFGLTGAEMARVLDSESTYLVGEQIRSMGLFATNQDFGLFCACLVPAGFFLAMSLPPGATGRRAVGLVSALLGIALVLSLTRTALLAAAVGTIAGTLFLGRGGFSTRALRTLVLLGGGGGLALWAAVSFGGTKVQAALARASTILDLGSDRSYNARLDVVLPRALDALKERLWGWGPGSAGTVSQQFQDDAPLGVLTTDNGYLMIAIQIGVAGVTLFVLILVAAMVGLGHSLAIEARAGAVALVSLLTAMVSAQYWSLLAPMGVVAAVVGVAAASRSQVPHRGEPPALPHTPPLLPRRR